MCQFRNALATAGLFLLSAYPAQALPDCLPEDGVYELAADYQERGKLYSFYFGGWDEDLLARYLILEENGQCNLLKTDLIDSHTLVIDSYVPEHVARQLYLENYSEEIEYSGGLGAYQQLIDSAIADDIARPFAYISPAEEWALLELGLTLPEYRTIASTDPRIQRIYNKLFDIDSPAILAEKINDIRLSEEYVRAEYIIDSSDSILIARDSGHGRLEFLFSGPIEDYNPSIIARENHIPMSVFEGFEE